MKAIFIDSRLQPIIGNYRTRLSKYVFIAKELEKPHEHKAVLIGIAGNVIAHDDDFAERIVYLL